MSIRSIDMQVLIPKATEVGKQQNNLAQQSTVQQQQVAEQMQKTAEVRQQQVQGLAKGEGGKVKREEPKEKHNHNHRRGNYGLNQHDLPEQENPEDEPMSKDPVLGHVIDIKT